MGRRELGENKKGEKMKIEIEINKYADAIDPLKPYYAIGLGATGTGKTPIDAIIDLLADLERNPYNKILTSQ